MLFRTDPSNWPSHTGNMPASVEGIMMKAVRAISMMDFVEYSTAKKVGFTALHLVAKTTAKRK